MHSPPEDGEIRESRRGNRKKHADVTPNISHSSGGRKNSSSDIKHSSSNPQDFGSTKGRSYRGDNLRNYYSTPGAAIANRKIFSSSHSHLPQRSSKHHICKCGTHQDNKLSGPQQSNTNHNC